MSGPGDGTRSYRATRRVRLGEVTPTGAARLDSIVRWLQDIAADDVRDAGIEGRVVWVVRRTTLEVTQRPLYNEPVELCTWCSGVGPAWAERRTTVTSAGRVAVEASSLWVSLDRVTNRPVMLGEWFFVAGSEGAHGRSVRGRLNHPGPPQAAPDAEAGTWRRAWPVRQADFDVLGHINNAIAWAAFDEEVSRVAAGRSVEAAEVEYRSAIESGDDLIVCGAEEGDGVSMWLTAADGAVMASGLVRLS